MESTMQPGLQPTKLEEANRALKKELHDRAMHRMTESLKQTFGVDLGDTKTFAFSSPWFSWKKFREASYELASKRMMEASAEGVFSQLLRAGINNLANSWYQLVQTDHEKVGAVTVSTHAVEPYAPLHRGGVPRRVMRGQPFPEVQIKGLDLQLTNWKFGAISTVERELIDDDQTGQVMQRVQDIGPNMAILEDAWFFTRFIGAAGSYAGDTIPASETYTTVFSTSGLTGGAINAITAAAFTPANVQALDLLLMNMVDLQGNKMMVNPNTLLTGTSNKFSARTLLNSEWYPASATIKVGGGSGADSGVGTTFARNVLEGMYQLVVSRFLSKKAYALGEAGKGIIFQMRDPLEVVQENPTAGPAFSQDEFRFRSRSRWNTDWIDPRFWALGNDGSV